MSDDTRDFLRALFANARPYLHPEWHAHADQHPSFGFNVRSGYGNCYVCGSILLKDICDTLNIHTAAYGSIFV